MSTVTRTFVREPSNSKCPGASRHLSIGGVKFVRGVATLAEGPAMISIAGSFAVGKGRTARLDRVSIEVPVIVTGDETDTIVGILDGGSQGFEVIFRGCKAA